MNDALLLTSVEVGLKASLLLFLPVESHITRLGLEAQLVLLESRTCTETHEAANKHLHQHLKTPKKSLPLQGIPLCPQIFCWFEEQMW